MSIKTTQSQIKQTNAIDITYMDNKEIRKIKESEGWFNEIAWSRGIYGVNGLLLQGNNTKQLYKITARTSSIYSI